MSSPTQRSLEVLKERGYLAYIVEHWNHFARIRQDLFGFIDIVALKAGEETLAVQTTDASSVSKRVRKIQAHVNFPTVHAAGWRVEVHGWMRPTKTIRGYRLRTVVVERDPEAEYVTALRVAHVARHPAPKRRRARVTQGV